LKGDKKAATDYLNRSTYNELYSKFQPVIKRSLNKKKALDQWSKVVSKYNKIPFIEKQNPELDDYITNKALDGLFAMVAKEELNIRNNVSARSSDLLRKVFAQQD
jgi:predicted choloylglycine hydrolase